MKTLKQIYESIVSNSFSEYYDALLTSYKKKFDNEEDAETFIEFLKTNDENTADAFGLEIKLEKEDSGTLIIAYAESSETVYLFGIVSINDKMNRNDLSAINSWIDKLIEKMKDGKNFITTPHELSLRLIKHIEEKIAKDPEYSLTKQIGRTVDLSQIGFILKDKRYSKYSTVTLNLIQK